MRDLASLESDLDAIDRIYYMGHLRATGITIAWGRWRKTTNTFRFGCYRPHLKRIEINPILAEDWVPGYVVTGTIFHECLHHVHGRKHSAEFRQAELQFPHWIADEMWRTENLNRLIAARPPRRRR
jgi:hypothetical protein